ncbi:hypothetical protein [Butyrivibrio sp. INlla16]|uniref:hypothetical protein n=1 Tax=Butyrivibrio sp. INlla16 TaxID=1520807 RepID=UPI00147BE3B3|nr:hypothetical protein [Butyrivibrio sp. INlla16]
MKWRKKKEQIRQLRKGPDLEKFLEGKKRKTMIRGRRRNGCIKEEHHRIKKSRKK